MKWLNWKFDWLRIISRDIETQVFLTIWLNTLLISFEDEGVFRDKFWTSNDMMLRKEWFVFFASSCKVTTRTYHTARVMSTRSGHPSDVKKEQLIYLWCWHLCWWMIKPDIMTGLFKIDSHHFQTKKTYPTVYVARIARVHVTYQRKTLEKIPIIIVIYIYFKPFFSSKQEQSFERT